MTDRGTLKRHILIIEDEPSLRLGMKHFLTSQGYAVSLCADGAQGMEAVKRGDFDLVITDIRLPHCSGFEILKNLKELHPDKGIILITAYADIKDAVHSIKEGAFDYIAKPFSNEELLITIERFFRFQSLENEVTLLRETLKRRESFADIIGASPGMKMVFDRISSIANTDVPVLIEGESGTGKELVANAIHNLSSRKDKPFVKINCAAIPEHLFESELFGHERGAFTGATETRKGKFEFASGGTIFFDEIGDIPLVLQPKLLRVIEEHVITRLGGNATIAVDVRIIYATSKNLKELVKEGKFREELFYRINVVPIQIPPLRQRREDIPYLIDHFLRHYMKKFDKQQLRISQEAYHALLSYHWPGNVRELKHAMERAVVLSKDGVITLRDLPEEVSGLSIPCLSEGYTLEESLRCFEREMICRALKDTGGKKTEAARKLGISRKVLWKKMKDYDIE
ncbi:MAG TPA: sigma-54-dependent Fis family transcriptional regulator [Nitrospirae bacterium]|nr:sigma-54-dependent Fis family transcriptional regulator [Nitrospirota bacterium]